jgi:hypothetical protein
MSGSAWNNLLSDANSSLPTIGIGGPANSGTARNGANVLVYAKALVYVRTGIESYRTEVQNAISQVIGTEHRSGGDALGLARSLKTWVIAADLVGLDEPLNTTFRNWLSNFLDRSYVTQSQSLIDKAETRPNNHGTHALASVAAVAIYLGDQAALDRVDLVTRGYLGDRSAYNENSSPGFSYGSLSWQFDSANPVGINPVGATKQGHDIDGVMPDDQRRCGSFNWPPCSTNYTRDVHQGLSMLGVILNRQGFDVWNYSDQAIKRSVDWLYSTADGKSQMPFTGDDEATLVLYDQAYGTSRWDGSSVAKTKTIGYTDWTHSQ